MGDLTTEVTVGHVGERERAVLSALIEQEGRVVDRVTLRHVAGLDELSPRRCESILVDIRRLLGADAVVTVRRRGWRLQPDAVGPAAAIVARSAWPSGPD